MVIDPDAQFAAAFARAGIPPRLMTEPELNMHLRKGGARQ
jgi:hypothetical protein